MNEPRPHFDFGGSFLPVVVCGLGVRDRRPQLCASLCRALLLFDTRVQGEVQWHFPACYQHPSRARRKEAHL